MKENSEVKYDPVQLTKELADKIGYDVLCKIVNGLYEPTEEGRLAREVKELQEYSHHLERENENLKGQIKALSYAVRVNGVSGNEVNYN